MDFQKIDTDLDEDEDELFFEGPDAEPETQPVAIDPPAPLPAAIAPLPDIVASPDIEPGTAKPSRKRTAKGKTAADPINPPAEPDPAPAPAAIDENPALAETAEKPVPAPIGEPVMIVRGSRIPAVAMGLAALAALFASTGLLVTLRSMTALETSRHEVAEREAALARLPALLEQVNTLATRQRVELDRQAAVRPADIVTNAELTRQINELRFGLSRMQAPGTTALAGVVRAGQTELADRIDDLSDRVDTIEHPRPTRATH